jgi:proteasome lid subunit RPN8/RPN11
VIHPILWNEFRFVAITIEEAFPCKSLATADDALNVEMDPKSEYEIRETIENKKMRIVGWYHSHPVFQPGIHSLLSVLDMMRFK